MNVAAQDSVMKLHRHAVTIMWVVVLVVATMAGFTFVTGFATALLIQQVLKAITSYIVKKKQKENN